jgi:PqqD family protein of HPr-rel-A system
MVARVCLRNPAPAVRVFGDEDLWVAYDATSGDTHLLDRVCLELFRLLSVSSATVDELRNSLLLNFPDDDPELIAQGIDAAIVRLERANLIVNEFN